MVFPKLSRIFSSSYHAVNHFLDISKLFVLTKISGTGGLGVSDLDRWSVWYLENDIDRMI